MTAQQSQPLETIGNYDLLEKIGEGCMGTVYKARHWETKEIVAIKVMPPEIAANPVLLKRFAQEFRITSQLDHPNIVHVKEFCGTGPSPYLVMELVEGESLGERLDRVGRLSEEEAIHIILQVAHGLHRAHRQGLIHRDVKPDNILVTADNVAKLTDLGLAKDSDAGADLTRTGRGLGTPDYMAPEQFRNAKNASIRCDIYSLGATLYHMVTGKVPFDEDDPVKAMIRKLRNELPAPRDLVPDISERTDWAIRRAMNANPDNRPASCREFAEDLLGTSTRPKEDSDGGGSDQDSWYVVFTDAAGVVRTAKGSSRALRRKLKAGDLGDPTQVRASKDTTGPFEPLHRLPEFRDLVAEPAPALQSATRLSELRSASLDGKPFSATVQPAMPPAVQRLPVREANHLPAAEPSLVQQTMTTVRRESDQPLPPPVGRTETPAEEGFSFNWWQTLLLIVATVFMTLGVVKYVLPFFN